MVQTRSATKPAHSNDAKDPPVESDIEAPAPAKTRRRQFKDTAASKKRHRGKPGELCQLNLDVLFLIAELLHPLDLLNLARTCKSLRVPLMDKSSEFVWRRTRRQIRGLPDCPADLTEPEYANLLFYARCHGCERHTKTIFWELRRRYCLDCRGNRLRPFYSCHQVIRASESRASIARIAVRRGPHLYVDREETDSFIWEYERCSDKTQFLSDRERRILAIRDHAHECENWQRDVAKEHREHLIIRRQERATSIFERLEQHGFGPELAYFGHDDIQRGLGSLFRTSKVLTDREWGRASPEWSEIMNNFRSRRLEAVAYRPRRHHLASQYVNYVTNPPPDTPALDLLPHLAEVARFPPFRDAIKAAEDSPAPPLLFETAFAQLPALVDEWRKKLDAELAELVKIPPHLSMQDTSDVASNNITAHTTSPQVNTDKLRLACALFFRTSTGVFSHPEVFSLVMRNRYYPDYEDTYESPIQDQFGFTFMEEASYIVHACGLDPNVATVEDMDRRNARIKCMSCQSQRVWSWRDALSHAYTAHPVIRVLPSKFPQWQAVSDERISAILAAEQSVKKKPLWQWGRCLLCRPHVGDALKQEDVNQHIMTRHNIKEGNIKRDVHWKPLGIFEEYSVPPEQRSLLYDV